jgi:ubiquinone/menaquinone biosynthesis C-methylase UbiE/ADP-ribose pyrophosphatase YjhB (NUDIX family)
MPEIASAALLEQDGAVLVAHRRAGGRPFGDRWMLPFEIVRGDETAEEALARHLREQFGVSVAGEDFVDTVYVEDSDTSRYVVNIFRTRLGAEPMRFRANGVHDDARYLTAPELSDVAMPPSLREPLVRLLTDPDAPATFTFEPAEGQALPLAERDGGHEEQEGEDVAGPAPDNRAGWDAISKAYQEQRYGERYNDRLMWSWRADEDTLQVLGDEVAGRRAIVLGCGGGQDVVALSKLGAVAVGVDFSKEQLAYARRHAALRGAQNASFAEADIRDLSRFDDESFDIAVSIHALGHVDDAAEVLAEAARVLKPAGLLAISIKHPCFDVSDGPPFQVYRSYWARHRDWTWDLTLATGEFRAYFHTLSEWFDMLTAAGFTIERLWEPDESNMPAPEGDVLNNAWLAQMPYTLVIKARKR